MNSLDIKSRLIALIRTAVESLCGAEVAKAKNFPLIGVEEPKLKQHGDYSSNIAMLLAKELRGNPRIITEVLRDPDPRRYLDPAVLDKFALSPLIGGMPHSRSED